MNATKTEIATGLNDVIVNGLRRALDLFQATIDEEIRKGADQQFLYTSQDSPIRDIRAAQAWLARTTHQIHREQAALED